MYKGRKCEQNKKQGNLRGGSCYATRSCMYKGRKCEQNKKQGNLRGGSCYATVSQMFEGMCEYEMGDRWALRKADLLKPVYRP